MSEMQRNRGIIKRLSTKENAKEVYRKLIADGTIRDKFNEIDTDGNPTYIEDERYEIVDGAIFDVSGAPDEYDGDEEVNEAERLNETDYRIHAYYYNGGGDLGEMLAESIPEADANYKKTEDIDERLYSVLEDNVPAHCVDMVRKEILEWHSKNK